MVPKIIGIGKCGSRITFDFSAFTYDHPAAYELRISEREAVNQITALYSRARQLFQDKIVDYRKRTPLRLWCEYESAAVDSDADRNEVLKLQQSHVVQHSGVKPISQTCKLGERSGGCQWGIVSEVEARAWLDQVDRRLKEESLRVLFDLAEVHGADMCLVATSLGGGTGSGTSGKLAEFLVELNSKRRPDAPFFVSVVGILPLSDEKYHDGEEPAPWAFDAGVNTGRALSDLLRVEGDRVVGCWLVSNDLLRGDPGESSGVKEAVMDAGITAINFHIASVTCLLANIGGIQVDGLKSIKSEENFDASEMRNVLGGSVYFSGYARTEQGAIGSNDEMRAYGRSLVVQALSSLNVRGEGGDDRVPSGCSLPFRKAEWDKKSLDAWIAGRDEALESTPVELRTAGKVAIIYGQDDRHYDDRKKNAVVKAVADLCPAAQVYRYPFRHSFRDGDHLCLMVADCFNRVVYRALIEYSIACFGAGDDFVERLDAVFEDGDVGTLKSTIEDALSEVEQYSAEFGAEPAGLSESLRLPDEPSSVLRSREQLSQAFQRLHAAFRRKARRRVTSRL